GRSTPRPPRAHRPARLRADLSTVRRSLRIAGSRGVRVMTALRCAGVACMSLAAQGCQIDLTPAADRALGMRRPRRAFDARAHEVFVIRCLAYELRLLRPGRPAAALAARA